ncbi:SpoIIE family protein phosphatase [Leptolyngbya sp. NK1-12]|uniref:SpoIIE family protein phosphatase n=1 Tax=Leptolyngbya sp. NK1-12 TaxID=2547451 RepID=A0AA96WM86_9CYAN|nr:SpoIIE family protein phosphatase [Leptolyngbya sp. NK1-12]
MERDLAIIVRELRATLGKMELALGSIDEAIVWTGEDATIQWCNTRFDQLVDKLHIAILGNSLLELLPLTCQGDPVTTANHPVVAVLQNAYKTTEYEFHPFDRPLILEISGACLEFKTGERAAVLTIRDVTERKRMEETLILANQEITALNRKLEAENLRMSAELDVTRKLQQMILPRSEELAAITSLDIAGFMEPADEVGGDYYDVLQCDEVITIGIGDVTGHGLESGILMVMTQTAVRTLSEMREADPVKFLDTLNRAIYQNIQRMNSDRSLTLAILNYADHQLSISGQHEETLIVRANGVIERINTKNLGFPIGLDDAIAPFISHASIRLESGDGIVLYTDGITEAENLAGEQYGIERLCGTVAQNWQATAEEIKQRVIADVHHHIGEQKIFDDITLLVLKQK